MANVGGHWYQIGISEAGYEDVNVHPEEQNRLPCKNAAAKLSLKPTFSLIHTRVCVLRLDRRSNWRRRQVHLSGLR